MQKSKKELCIDLLKMRLAQKEYEKKHTLVATCDKKYYVDKIDLFLLSFFTDYQSIVDRIKEHSI